jgi:DNA-binding GntR family transcriptional regulator
MPSKATRFKIDAPVSLANRVAMRLREAIVAGEFALGELISEETLAESFGVSRTPVREALNQLQRLGLVVVRPQRGTYVFEPQESDIAAICEFRSIVEPRAAVLAKQYAPEATVRTLEESLEEMRAAMLARDAVRYGRADTRLHEAFFDNCGNAYLQTAYETAAAKIAALRTHLSAPADVLHPIGLQQHQALLDFFLADDFVGFEKLMRLHVTGTRDNYVNSLLARTTNGGPSLKDSSLTTA